MKRFIFAFGGFILLMCCAKGEEFWEGAKRTFHLQRDSLTGPTKVMESDSSVITVCSGLIRTALVFPAPGFYPSRANPITALPSGTRMGSDDMAQLGSFTFCHINKSTFKQTWLFSSGWFQDGSVRPSSWQRRICGMTKDETGLWLLVWQGKEPSVSNEVFQVIAFAASTGACVCNTPLNFDATNKMMSGFLEKFQDSGGYGGTHDYLGDLAIKRQDDKLFIFGDMHLVGTLLTTNANQAIHGTYRKLDDPGR